MSIYKSNKKPRFYYIDGHVTIKGEKHHYSKQSITNEKFKDKKRVEELEKEMVHDLFRKYGRLDPRFNNYTLDDLVKDFLKKNDADGKKRSTINAIEYKFNKYYKPFFGEKALVEDCFTEDKILDFKIMIKNLDASTDYKNLILNTLSSLVNYAARKKIITYEDERMLVDDLEPFKNFEGKSNLHKFTSLEDAKKVWENASNEYFRYIIEFLYYSGCRISEFLAIQFKDVDCGKDINDELVISCDINKQIFTLEEGPVPYLKNASSIRTTYFVGEVAKHFLEFLDKYKFKEDDLLFKVSKSSLRREMSNAFKKAGVTHNTLHGFGRKSIATNLYMETKDGKLPQLLLGHKNIDMTLNTYVLESSMKNELLNGLKDLET